MKRLDLVERLAEMEINPNTISFYQDRDGLDDHDTFLSTCDVSGEETMCAGCWALDSNGDPVYFEASEFLIGGILGKLAGAF